MYFEVPEFEIHQEMPVEDDDFNILQHNRRICVADTAIEFSWTPEPSSSRPLSKQGLSPE
jgi:hypothetical protein